MLTVLDPDRTPPRAFLAALQKPSESDEQLRHSLDELARLCDTLGITVVGSVWQKRSSPDPATVLGSGKVTELKQQLEALDVSDAAGHDPFSRQPVEVPDIIVVFDDGLSPSQTLHLSAAVGAPVLDRNTIILEIFHRHARTRMAQLQVEIVRLEYQAPRVRTGAQRAERAGGIGAKGKGESHIELDRRKIRDRIAELRLERSRIEAKSEQLRRGRALPQVALVGYTNAGKSTLMRALTGAEVYIADKLFATLDTRVRLLSPQTRPPVLVSDTVGFIKKLPHGLIDSFKATLDEALDAALLLHVLDASSEAWAVELATTVQVLGEIGAADKPRQLLFNKCDRLTPEQLRVLRIQYPDALFISALNSEDVSRLHRVVWDFFQREMQEVSRTFGWHEHALVAWLHENAVVTSEKHEDTGTFLTFRATPAMLEALQAKTLPQRLSTEEAAT